MSEHPTFQINDFLSEKPVYILSDMEDFIYSLSLENPTGPVSRLSDEFTRVMTFSQSQNDFSNSFISIEFIDNNCWCTSQYPLNNYWLELLTKSIDLYYSKPEEAVNLLQEEVRRIWRTKIEEERKYFFDVRRITDFFFRESNRTEFKIHKINNTPYLKIKYWLGKQVNAEENAIKTEKRFLRLTSTEERVEQLLDESSTSITLEHKQLILKSFSDNNDFLSKCLSNNKYLKLFFESELIEILQVLRSIHFSGDFFDEFPEIFWQLRTIKKIFISKGHFQTIPHNLKKLKRLTYLGLPQNKIECIDESLGELHQLEELWLHENRLKTFPDSLSNLSSLKELCLDRNPIAEFPSFFANLKHLKHIRITDCQLTNVPSFIGDMKGLKQLILRRNQIKDISNHVLHCKTLRELGIADNQIPMERLKELKELRDTINPNLEIDVFDVERFKLL